ncbi:hypothetical protein K474DRAFT_1709106 [Panus rudis PR-1116 ss-1]|nr:hypothetical protein K474DRAFT_1709106 [Panus rudis PR-1116 ss-1]
MFTHKLYVAVIIAAVTSSTVGLVIPRESSPEVGLPDSTPSVPYNAGTTYDDLPDLPTFDDGDDESFPQPTLPVPMLTGSVAVDAESDGDDSSFTASESKRSFFPRHPRSLEPRRSHRGGDASTGNSGSVNGGNISNDAGSGTLTNPSGSNVAGTGGTTRTGTATAGNGRAGSSGTSRGGDARSGNAGSANGGSITNKGGNINNANDANQPGNGGTSRSGDAFGGNARD